MKTVSLTTRLQRKERILQQEAAGTIVLLDVDSGQYYALDEVGGRVWNLCDGSRTVSELVAVLSEEFEAPAETIQRDLVELLTDLANENLVGEDTPEVDGAPAAP
jgi:hypothetical protein